jgi:hypothetical protein
MFENIAAAVDTWPLAVPQREHTIISSLSNQSQLLTPPDGGGGEFLVDARLELYVMRIQVLLRLPQRFIVQSEG